MNKPTILLIVTAVLSCSAPATVARPSSPSPPPSAAAPARYVDLAQIEALSLPPPPADDSEAGRADLAAVLSAMATRSDADCERAERTFIVTFDALWGERSPFPSPLPAEARAFFDRLDSEIGTAAREMKNRFRRPRPESVPCPGPSRMRKGGGHSYPSTHAAISRLFALVLADLAPERRAEFLSRADAIAEDRLIIGVHYPSDLAAGKALADQFHERLARAEAYRRDLARVKALSAK